MLVHGVHRQFWRPTLHGSFLAVSAVVVGGVGFLVRPEPAVVDGWWVSVLLIAPLALLVGLLGTVGAWVGPGRHRVVDTGTALRLHRWWGVREVAWGDVERVVLAEDGDAEGTAFNGVTDALPRLVVVARDGHRSRVTFVALGDELVGARGRVAAACSLRGIEVSETDIGWWGRQRERWLARRARRR